MKTPTYSIGTDIIPNYEKELLNSLPQLYPDKKERKLVETILIPQFRTLLAQLFDGFHEDKKRDAEELLSPQELSELCTEVDKMIKGSRKILDAEGLFKPVLQKVEKIRELVKEELEKNYYKQYIDAILKLKPTAEEWVDMGQKEKQAFTLGDMRLNAIATVFGVDGSPIRNHPVHLALGRKIYGEDIEGLEEKRLKKLKKKILKLKPTAEEWVGMEYKEKQTFAVGDMKLNAIARVFGVEGDPIGNHPVHLALGRKIYGEGVECLQELNLAELKERILKLKPTEEEWVGMKYKEKQAFAVGDMKLRAIATVFGVEGDPVGNHPVHLALGRKIYVEGVENLEEKRLAELKEGILKFKPTAEEWVGMKKKEKRAFAVGDMKLIAIARVFGVEGDPISNHSVHLALGRKIYGEGVECLQELDLEKLKKRILKFKPTAEEWVGMKYKEKQAFAVGDMKLNAIATVFGVDGSPIRNHPVHLALGRRIYGEGVEDFEEKRLAELKEGILKFKPTAGEWVGMTAKEKRAFAVGDTKLNAISTVFGVEGDPISNHSVHLALGRKIYGEGVECLQAKKK